MDETLSAKNRTQEWWTAVIWILTSGPDYHKQAVPGTPRKVLENQFLARLETVIAQTKTEIKSTVLENYLIVLDDVLLLISWTKKNNVFDATWEMPLQQTSLDSTLTMPSMPQLLFQNFQEVVNSAWKHCEDSGFNKRNDAKTGQLQSTKKNQENGTEPTFTSFMVAGPSNQVTGNAGICSWCKNMMLETNAPIKFVRGFCNTMHYLY